MPNVFTEFLPNWPKFLEKFNVALGKAKFIVGQNLGFDINIMGCDFYRMGVTSPMGSMPILDTCTEVTASFKNKLFCINSIFTTFNFLGNTETNAKSNSFCYRFSITLDLLVTSILSATLGLRFMDSDKK